LSTSMPPGLPAVIGTPNNIAREKLFRRNDASYSE
jgi:hypothetical protein